MGSRNLYSVGIDAKLRPKVLVYGPFQPPDKACGISAAVRTFAGSRVRHHYDVECVSTFRPPLERGLLERLAFGIWLSARTALRMLSSGAVLADIHTASDRSLLSHAAVLFGARMARCPALLRIHGGEFVRFFEQSGNVQRALIRFILRSATRVIALSEGWQTRLAAIEPRAVIEVIPNSIDCSAFERLADRPRRECRRILFLANFSERKGHFDALEAIGRLAPQFQDLRLALGGEDRDVGTRVHIECEAERLGIRRHIEFLGTVSNRAKEQALRDADVLILPSHAENMPISVMEGMACALPVIATAVGAIGEMIEDGATGLLIKAHDPGALAQNLQHLFCDADFGRRLGRKAQQYARMTWDADVVADRTMALYGRLTTHRDCRDTRSSAS